MPGYRKIAVIFLFLVPVIFFLSLLGFLKYSPASFLPDSAGRLVRGGSASYNPFEGTFRVTDLILQDVKNKFLLTLPDSKLDFHLWDLLTRRDGIFIRQFHMEAPQLVFINTDEPIQGKKVVTIREGLSVYIQKNFPNVKIDRISISDGSLNFIDHPGKSHATITHTVSKIDLEANHCEVKDLSRCEGRLQFDLNTENSPYPASVFEANLKPVPDGSVRSVLEFKSNQPLFLRHYDLYLGSRGYRILSGFAYLRGTWIISEEEIAYNNRVVVAKLDLEDRRDGTAAFFRNMILPTYLDLISDEDETIRVFSAGKIDFNRGTKFALRTIKQNLLRSVEKRLTDY